VVRAYGYEPLSAGYMLHDDHVLNWMMGAGGNYSTMEDMVRWYRALASETLVTKATLDQAFQPATLNDGSVSDYGFGWRVASYKGRRQHSHGGAWVGFRAAIVRLPDDALTVVVLSNRGDCDPEGLADSVVDLFLGDSADAVDAIDAIDAADGSDPSEKD